VKHLKEVSNPSNMSSMQDMSAKLAREYADAVFSDGVVPSVLKQSQILELLQEHIFNHVVVANNERGTSTFYAQKDGIAQGSVMSSLLCNVYYGDIEKKLLGELFKEEDKSYPRLLVRVVDDFLVVTTKKEECASFLHIMTAGDDELGVKINPKKTSTNLELEGFEDNLVQSANFQWCGMVFDMNTFETRIDYADRFSNAAAVNALTVDTTKNPGHALRTKMKSFVRPRCIPILTDDRVNSRGCIEANVYQVFLLGAVKTRGYLVGLPGKVGANAKFVVDCVVDLVDYVFALLCKQVRVEGGEFKLSRMHT